LHIEYPTAYQIDVEAALWAWEHFGGLGARTRRGLGAVERLNDQQQPIAHNTPLADRLSDSLRQHVVAGTWPNHTPHISNVTVGNYGGATAASIFFNNKPLQVDARTVWGNLFETYRDFRQHRFLRNGRPHGENIWPEPNSLRQMENAPLRTVPPFAMPGFQSHFPRAQMGMPVEHFFTRTKFNPRINDAVKRTINIPDMHDSTKEGRFASPVLFRPIRDGNTYKGIVVILGGSRAPQIAKVIETRNQAFVYGTPTAGQTHGPELLNRVGQPHGPTTTDDVLQGLFNFLTKI
jgi:CRISPR-associated protein Cmr1